MAVAGRVTENFAATAFLNSMAPRESMPACRDFQCSTGHNKVQDVIVEISRAGDVCLSVELFNPEGMSSFRVLAIQKEELNIQMYRRSLRAVCKFPK